MPNTKDEVFGYSVKVDAKDATNSIVGLYKKSKDSFGKITKSVVKMNTGFKKMGTLMATPFKKMNDHIKVANKQYQTLTDNLSEATKKLDHLNKMAKTANANTVGSISKEIEEWSNIKKSAEDALKKSFKNRAIKAGKTPSLKEHGDMAKGALKGVQALLKKDLDGMAEHVGDVIKTGFTAAADVMKGTFEVGDKVFWNTGDKWLDDAKRLWKQGGAGGKMAAAGAGAAGGAMKGIGGIMKVMGGLGPAVQMLAKIGPILSAVASGLMSIVQLLIDAEAAAKEMNKEILKSGPSAQFLAGKFDSVGAAIEDTNQSLKKIRDSATSLDNIKWGINKEDHMAVISTLQQEGVTIKDLEKHFEDVGKTADGSASSVKNFGDVVHMSVAYSRLFGVSLQDISSMQGEMMKDMGYSLTQVEASFASMVKGAEEGGIATNKFFAIIRGVSADLNLYNTRMEDAVHTLTLLGKVMSPRNAQKFMQTAMKGLQGMGRMDLIKLNIMSGNKAGKRVKEDTDLKSKSLLTALNTAGSKASGADLQDVLNGTKDMSDVLEGVSKDQQGTLRDTLVELRQQTRMQKKGGTAAAMALHGVGPGAALDTVKDAILKIGGGQYKSLGEAEGSLGPEMVADMLGKSQDELREMIKFEGAIDEQKGLLKKQLKQVKKGSPEESNLLKKLQDAGIDANDIDHADSSKIMETLDEGTQKDLAHAKTQEEYAKDTGQFQSTVMDKLGALVEFLMNQLYNVMTSIWDTLLDFADMFHVGDAAKRKTDKMALLAAKSGNKELADIVAKNSGNADAAHKDLINSGVAKNMASDILDAPKKVADLTAKIKETQQQMASSTDDNEKKQLQAQLTGLSKQKDAITAQTAAMEESIDESLGGSGHDLDQMSDRLESAMKMAGITGPGKIDEAKDNLKKTGHVGGAMQGLSDESQAKILEKLRLTLGPEQLVSVLGDYAKSNKGAAPTQQQAADRAANPGQATPPGAPKPPTAPAPGTPASSDAAVTPSPMGAPAVAAANAAAKDAPTSDQQDMVISSLDDQSKLLGSRGIKINKSFLENNMQRTMREATLDAARTALGEYYLMTQMSPDTIMGQLKKGVAIGDIGTQAAARVAKGGDINKPDTNADAGVSGKWFKGVSGEGLALLGRDEGIVNKKAMTGGGASVNVTINGPGAADLEKAMRAAATNVVNDWLQSNGGNRRSAG